MPRRVLAAFATALFLLTGPGTVAGVIPWWITRWRLHALGPIEIAGGLLILGALCVLIESFARFAWKGLGTPVPVFPTRHLVVSGLYRFVRNPMYVAVVSAIFGQALLFDSLPLAGYGAIVWVFFHMFVVLYEEPTLQKTFGAEYESFRAHVPRWIPRLTPWAG
ncbi:MAG TPA: isoprenylcysteine carboxylmethyltransferase family protein [Bryobacteraceae bacterium]|nr:isoprenylcysteine carboxylmethyltransferase family protein [Bryobacteraceae bacterium]